MDLDDPDALDDDLDLELPEPLLRDSDLEREVDDLEDDERLDVPFELLRDVLLESRLELRPLLSL